jgi:hypothetical protein
VIVIWSSTRGGHWPLLVIVIVDGFYYLYYCGIGLFCGTKVNLTSPTNAIYLCTVHKKNLQAFRLCVSYVRWVSINFFRRAVGMTSAGGSLLGTPRKERVKDSVIIPVSPCRVFSVVPIGRAVSERDSKDTHKMDPSRPEPRSSSHSENSKWWYLDTYWGRPVMFVIHIIKHKTLNFALMTTLITHFFYDMLHKHKNLIRGGPPPIKFLCNI